MTLSTHFLSGSKLSCWRIDDVTNKKPNPINKNLSHQLVYSITQTNRSKSLNGFRMGNFENETNEDIICTF